MSSIICMLDDIKNNINFSENNNLDSKLRKEFSLILVKRMSEQMPLDKMRGMLGQHDVSIETVMNVGNIKRTDNAEDVVYISVNTQEGDRIGSISVLGWRDI